MKHHSLSMDNVHFRDAGWDAFLRLPCKVQ